MSTDQLLQAMRDYLEEEDCLLECAPKEMSRETLRHDLDRVRRSLQERLDAVAPPHEPAFRRIMVAVDASEQCGWALATAARLAEQLGSRVGILHVIVEPAPVGTELGFIGTPTYAELEKEAKRLVAEARKRLPADANVETMVRVGEPAGVIVHVAKEWDADLLVLGTHARGRLARLLLGSTAAYVVRHAHCAVLTVAHRPAFVPEPAHAPQLEDRAVAMHA